MLYCTWILPQSHNNNSSFPNLRPCELGTGALHNYHFVVCPFGFQSHPSFLSRTTPFLFSFYVINQALITRTLIIDHNLTSHVVHFLYFPAYVVSYLFTNLYIFNTCTSTLCII